MPSDGLGGFTGKRLEEPLEERPEFRREARMAEILPSGESVPATAGRAVIARSSISRLAAGDGGVAVAAGPRRPFLWTELLGPAFHVPNIRAVCGIAVRNRMAIPRRVRTESTRMKPCRNL
ncbi:hypothetical protein GCM10010232_16370 [Streptomyces amakusaensis]